MYKRLSFLALLFITLSSFSFDKSLLPGIWVFDGKSGELVYSEEVPNEHCYIFGENGKLTVRQNVGWCGTPPITYGNYNGSWKQISENEILLKYSYWGGDVEAVWTISELTEDLIRYSAEVAYLEKDR